MQTFRQMGGEKHGKIANVICERSLITVILYTVTRSQINKRCLLRVKIEKYAFLVTLKPLRSMRRGKAELCNYDISQGKDVYHNSIKCFITFPISDPSSCVHQHTQDESIRAEDTSQLHLKFSNEDIYLAFIGTQYQDHNGF